MADKSDDKPDSQAFERFEKLVKRVISVPKSEIDRRAEQWKAARESELLKQ